MALSPDQRRRLLRMNMLMSYAAFASAKATTAWTPATLFANAEVGGWYDPSDLTTMFQDAAGTTPAALESPVGLVLDKSKGLVLGSELVTNGTFDTDTTGWTANGGATIAWSSGEISVTRTVAASDVAYQTFTTVVGKTYKVTFGGSAPTNIRIANSTNFLTTVASSNVSPFYFVATATTTYIGLQGNTTPAKYDNISVRELPGNHLSQSTSTARPVLSARVNQYTFSEDFSNAVWTTSGSTSSSAPIHADPLGGTKACLLAETTGASATHFSSQSSSFVSGVSYTMSVAMKKGSGATAPDWMQLTFPGAAFGTSQYANFNISTGEVGTVNGGIASITSMGGGYYRCTFTASATSTASGVAGVVFNNNSNTSGRVPGYVGATTSNVFVWGADLRPANAGVGLPAYQRVGAATSGSSSSAGTADYDATGFPYYLKFDGTDDFLVSGNISPGSVDKAQVFAGVRKVTDSESYQVIAESSYDTGFNNGAFVLATNVGTYGIFSKGTVLASASATGYSAPITNVVASLLDISGDLATLRANGAQVSQSTANQGTGNFGSYPLYVGVRYGTTTRTLLLNGHLYSLILRFSATNMDAATIAATETWVNQRTKAY